MSNIALVITGVLGLGAVAFGAPKEGADRPMSFLTGSEDDPGRSPSNDPWSRDYVDRPVVTFSNCDAARRAGSAPIHRGEPGYSTRLDGDLDGIACEPYYGR